MPHYARLTRPFFPYLLFISSVFLIGTFIVYATLSEIRNVHGATIMCHVASLAVMYIGLGVVQSADLASFPNGACVALGQLTLFRLLRRFQVQSVNWLDKHLSR